MANRLVQFTLHLISLAPGSRPRYTALPWSSSAVIMEPRGVGRKGSWHTCAWGIKSCRVLPRFQPRPEPHIRQLQKIVESAMAAESPCWFPRLSVPRGAVVGNLAVNQSRQMEAP